MNMTDNVARATLALQGKVRFSLLKPVKDPDVSTGRLEFLQDLADIPEPILASGDLYSSAG